PCGDSTLPANTGTATSTGDNCSGTVIIAYSDAPTEANCTGKAGIDRTWYASDACHNTNSCVQHISFADTIAPNISCPADKVLACGDSTLPANTGIATSTGDNCGGTVIIAYSDAPTEANCTGKAGIDRTWYASDACHNTNSCVQHISFADSTPPVITCSTNAVFECDGSGNTA